MRQIQRASIGTIIVVSFLGVGKAQERIADQLPIGHPETELARSSHPHIHPDGDPGLVLFFGEAFRHNPVVHRLADWGIARSLYVYDPQWVNFDSFIGLNVEDIRLLGTGCSGDVHLTCSGSESGFVEPAELRKLAWVHNLTSLHLDLQAQKLSPDFYRSFEEVVRATMPKRLLLWFGPTADQGFDLCEVEMPSSVVSINLQLTDSIVLPPETTHVQVDGEGFRSSPYPNTADFVELREGFLPTADTGGVISDRFPTTVVASGQGLLDLIAVNCDD